MAGEKCFFTSFPLWHILAGVRIHSKLCPTEYLLNDRNGELRGKGEKRERENRETKKENG
jgi:hypothetical protein